MLINLKILKEDGTFKIIKRSIQEAELFALRMSENGAFGAITRLDKKALRFHWEVTALEVAQMIHTAEKELKNGYQTYLVYNEKNNGLGLYWREI